MTQELPSTHMDLYKEFCKLRGSKIHFKTVDGEYEGILKLILPKKQRVTFEHVYYVPTEEYMGNRHFFFKEFISFVVSEPAERSPKFEKWDYLSEILERKFTGNRYRINDLVDRGLDESESEEDIPYSDEAVRDDFVLELPSNLTCKLPLDTVILNACNEEYDQAINFILKQRVVGVSFEGPKISRFGKLSWVSISTSDCVFMFDIELMGKSAFENGLRAIFGDKNIEKVIHDCRQPADCLNNLYDTQLINVFDTQVADFIVNMQRYSGKQTFKYVSSLDCCLVSHLDVPQEFLHNRKKFLSPFDEENFFKVRPVSHEFRNVVIKNAIYLIPLRDVLSELLLSPFRKAVDVYLKVLSNASEPELLLEPSVPDKVPPALILQGIQTVHFQDVPDISSFPLTCKFTDSNNKPVINHHKINNQSKNDFVAPVINHHHKINNQLKNDVESYVEDETSHGMISEKETREESKIKYIQIPKNHTTQQSVIIDELHASSSRAHIDNVYHRLVNNLSGLPSAENIDIKPSKEYVSNFTVRKPFAEALKPETENKTCDTTSKLNDCIQNISDCSFSEDNSTNSENNWSQLRDTFGISSYISEKSEKLNKKIKFIPAGMYC